MQKESHKSRETPPPPFFPHLGVFVLSTLHPELHSFWETIRRDLCQLEPKKRFSFFSRSICEWAISISHPAFLLPSLLALINWINTSDVLNKPYHFLHWECWLLFEGDLSLEQELDLRAKIVGKKADRETYQIYFPIGNGHFYKGSHHISAHASPDLDTLICSFWGWMDAFGAKVCDHLHVWHIPAGEINPTDQSFLDSLLGAGSFSLLCRRKNKLEPEAIDLTVSCPFLSWTNNLFIKTSPYIILTDERGVYVGEWNSQDTENFYSVVMPFIHLLESFEMQMRSDLLLCFSQNETNQALKQFFISSCKKNLKEYTTFQRHSLVTQSRLQTLCEKIFFLPLNSTIQELASVFDQHKIGELSLFFEKLERMTHCNFSEIEMHSIFLQIRETLCPLETVSESCLAFLQKGQQALLIKEHVWKEEARWVTDQISFEQIKEMFHKKNSPISLVYLDEQDNPFPLGYIESHRMHSPHCGTVSLRDFSNREEASLSSALDIISVIDHHKTSIATSAPSILLTSDVQACSVLLNELEKSFSLHQKYSEGTYLHPERVQLFSISLLAAIFDDTDLLAKGKKRDCIAVHDLLQDLEGEKWSWNKGATLEKIKEKILASDSAFQIYSKFFDLRKINIDKAICCAAKGRSFELFSDTKCQGCDVLIGQSKLFLENWTTLNKNRAEVLQQWLIFGPSQNRNAPFYVHLMSTLLSAKQIMNLESHPKEHQDQLWLVGQSSEMMKDFLQQLIESELAEEEIKIELIKGSNMRSTNHPILISCQCVAKQKINQSVLILHFPAGKLNSRKGSITPHIPVRIKI